MIYKTIFSILSDGLLPVSKRKTALITEHTANNSTGARSSGTSLHIIRTLGKAGHRVIFVTITTPTSKTTTPERRSSVTSYSKYVYKHYNVKMAPNSSQYGIDQKCIMEILSIAEKESIDWFIPMTSNYNAGGDSIESDWYTELSMGSSLLSDVTVAKLLKNMLPEVKSFIKYDSPYTTRILSDKLYFLLECKRMDLRVPNFHLVESGTEFRKLQREGVFSNPEESYYILSMHQQTRDLKEIGNVHAFLFQIIMSYTMCNTDCVD